MGIDRGVGGDILALSSFGNWKFPPNRVNFNDISNFCIRLS